MLPPPGTVIAAVACGVDQRANEDYGENANVDGEGDDRKTSRAGRTFHQRRQEPQRGREEVLLALAVVVLAEELRQRSQLVGNAIINPIGSIHKNKCDRQTVDEIGRPHKAESIAIDEGVAPHQHEIEPFDRALRIGAELVGDLAHELEGSSRRLKRWQVGRTERYFQEKFPSLD